MPPATEVLGYAASIIVLISLLMDSAWRLRVINLAGALTFTLYGALIGAAPVAVVNAAIALIDLWHLRRLTMSPAPAGTRPRAG